MRHSGGIPPLGISIWFFLAGAASFSRPLSAGEAIRLEYRFPAPEASRGKAFDAIRMEGLSLVGREACPLLPKRLGRILLPRGATLESISVEPADARVLPGRFLLAPAPRALAPGEAGSSDEPELDAAVYNSPGPYPESPIETLGVGRKHGRRIVLLSLSPLRYYPASGRVEYFEALTVEVRTRPEEPEEERSVRFAPRWAAAELAEGVDNPEEADENRYQTVYAAGPGAVAASTAGIVP